MMIVAAGSAREKDMLEIVMTRNPVYGPS